MRLSEEYLLRNSLNPRHARHVARGFLYFQDGRRLLSIEWVAHGPHPGFYEVSECVLERVCRTLSSARVEWDEYESYLVDWRSRATDLVFDKQKIFDLTWRYFLRRHESVILGVLPLSCILKTIDESNPQRIVDCLGMVERLDALDSSLSGFWRSRAFEVVSLYCHWMKDI